jgi:hypothetical protein
MNSSWCLSSLLPLKSSQYLIYTIQKQPQQDTAKWPALEILVSDGRDGKAFLKPGSMTSYFLKD